MKLTINKTQNNIIVTNQTKTILVYPFNLAIDKIPLSAFVNKGDLLAGLGAGTYGNIPLGATEGQVLVRRIAEQYGLKWEAQLNAAISSQFWLGVGSGIVPTTGGCAVQTKDTELATYKANSRVAAFDPTTEEHIEFEHAFPSDYGGGVLTAKFYWKHKATTTNFGVVWGIEAVSFGDGENIDGADFGSPINITDTGGNTDYNYISPITGDITVAGTPVAGELARYRVFRKAADAADTLAIDALLMGVMINYVRAG